MQLTEENLLTLEFHKGYMAGEEDAIKDFHNDMDNYERLLNKYRCGYKKGYEDRKRYDDNRKGSSNLSQEIIKEIKK